MKPDEGMERLLESYSRTIHFEGKQRVLDRLTRTRPERARLTIGRRIALVLAAVLMLTAVVGLADDIIGVIRKVAFGVIDAEQLSDDQWELTMDGGCTYSMESVGYFDDEPPSEADIDAIDEWEDTTLSDIDEVRALFDFLREPAWLPDGFEFQSATFFRYPSGRLNPRVTLNYGKDSYGYMLLVEIEQWKLGHEAKLEVQTVNQIEQLKVGSHDALGIWKPKGGLEKLWWQEGDVMISVSAPFEDYVWGVANSLVGEE